MNTFVLSSLCALALNAAGAEAPRDTVDRFVVDGKRIENFDGSALVGRTVTDYRVTYDNPSRRTVRRTHEISTAPGFSLKGLEGLESLKNFDWSGLEGLGDRIESLKIQIPDSLDLGKLGKAGVMLSPLVVIDGEVVENGLSSLDPRDIVSINVYKPGSERALSYGEQGKDGVISIETRKGAGDGAATRQLMLIDGRESPHSALSEIVPGDIESMTVYKNPEDVRKYTGDRSVGTVIVVKTKK